MPLNALMMPITVPNNPTNGAVEPMVARPERPRFISACTMATERSRPRLAASITSSSLTCAEAAWNSESPWRPPWRCGSSCCARRWRSLRRACCLSARPPPAARKSRDCLRAALYINARSIMMPTDHADIMKRMATTVLAGMPMLCHMLTRSQPTSPAAAETSPRWPTVNSKTYICPPPFLRNDRGSKILPVGFYFPQPQPREGLEAKPCLTA